MAAPLLEGLHSLCTKFVIFLFLQQAQMFSKARLENKRKKKCLVSSASTYPNQHDTCQEQESLERSVNPCPGGQRATLFPPSPDWALPKDERPCRRQRGHRSSHRRFLGLLRTEKGNNDSALGEQLPVVLKLLRT